MLHVIELEVIEWAVIVNVFTLRYLRPSILYELIICPHLVGMCFYVAEQQEDVTVQSYTDR